MAVGVRPADLDRDRQELIQLLSANLSPEYDAPRFDWLYLQNPYGPARAWIATDDASGRMVGAAAAFPRDIRLDGATARGYVLGDFCIAPECRSLGPALALQRACLKGLAEDEDAAWFDFPGEGMLAIYRRLGMDTGGRIVRYARLLRVDAQVRRRIAQPALAGGISMVGNLALAMQRRRTPLASALAIAVHSGLFGDEFTALDARANDLYPARGRRSAEYLNWRYRRNPLRTYQAVVARREGEVLAYAMVSVTDTEWRIADLFSAGSAADGGRAAADILYYVEGLARKQGAQMLTAMMTEESPFCPQLKAAGFSAREGHPVIVHARNADRWLLMDGDRES